MDVVLSCADAGGCEAYLPLTLEDVGALAQAISCILWKLEDASSVMLVLPTRLSNQN
jgi:hypothetical protein